MDGPAPRLTIGIPTYNRAPKLERALEAFTAQIERDGLTGRVDIVVSDNASTDDTPAVCARFAGRAGATVRVLRQEDNLGFNGNVWALYRACEAGHLWTFADDDLPFDGAVAKVLAAVEAEDPDVLLFSFVQPPGSRVRTFDLPDAVTTTTEPSACARFVCQMPKISMYVYRRVELSPASARLIESQILESGFAYVSLALSILDDAPAPRVTVIAEPLATCDDGYITLRISPEDFGRAHQMWTHPFVRRHAPQLAEDADRKSYLSLLAFLWGWRTGRVVVEPEYLDEWWRSLKDLPPRWPALVSEPAALLRFVLLKSEPRVVPRWLNLAVAAARRLDPRSRGTAPE